MVVASSKGIQRCLSWYLNFVCLEGRVWWFFCLLVFVELDRLKHHEVLLGNLYHINYVIFAIVS